MQLRALILAFMTPLLLGAKHSRPLVEGLDHVPVAVRNLEQAAADFSKLGFVIKPGRGHDDGIRNVHVKFPNGGGIELITASSPTDSLAGEYVDWLTGGDGAAFWSLYSSDLISLSAKLTELKLTPDNQGDVVVFSQASLPHRLFFADRLRSPTDGPDYWAHPNTAYKLSGVWLAGTAAERGILSSLGARREHDRCSPFAGKAAAFALPGEGDEVMFARDLHRSAERSIVGLTVLVKSLVTARRVLESNHVSYLQPRGCGNQSIWIAPENAHNLWLEFHQPTR